MVLEGINIVCVVHPSTPCSKIVDDSSTEEIKIFKAEYTKKKVKKSKKEKKKDEKKEKKRKRDIKLKKEQEEQKLKQKEATLKYLRSTCEKNYANTIYNTICEEKKLNKSNAQSSQWKFLCESFKMTTLEKQFYNSSFTQEILQCADAQEFYIEALKVRLGEVFGKIGTKLLVNDAFDTFKPEGDPLVLFICQKNLTTDILPSNVETYFTLSKGIEYNLIPSNIKEGNLIAHQMPDALGKTPHFYGLFHSFIHSVNFLVAYYKIDENKWVSGWILFDRYIKREENFFDLD